MSFVRLVILNYLFCCQLTSKTLSLELLSRLVTLDEFFNESVDSNIRSENTPE